MIVISTDKTTMRHYFQSFL